MQRLDAWQLEGVQPIKNGLNTHLPFPLSPPQLPPYQIKMFYDSLLQVFWNFPGPLHPLLERQDDHSFLKLKFQVFQDVPGGSCLFFHEKF